MLMLICWCYSLFAPYWRGSLQQFLFPHFSSDGQQSTITEYTFRKEHYLNRYHNPQQCSFSLWF